MLRFEVAIHITPPFYRIVWQRIVKHRGPQPTSTPCHVSASCTARKARACAALSATAVAAWRGYGDARPAARGGCFAFLACAQERTLKRAPPSAEEPGRPTGTNSDFYISPLTRPDLQSHADANERRRLRHGLRIGDINDSRVATVRICRARDWSTMWKLPSTVLGPCMA